MTLAVVLATSAASPVLAQPASAGLARELVSALAARHLDAFAARDPQAPDGFVGALLYPGVQLLVVAARHPAPAVVQQQLDAGRYRDVYVVLQTNPIPDSKLFVQDMQADGLRATADQTADIVYEKVVDQTVLMGDPKSSTYRATLSSKDKAYSRVLQILIDALKTAPAANTVAAVH